jgi:hypothetical protein
LVKWIWLGGVIVVMGTIVALMPNRRNAFVLSAVQQPAGAPPVTPALQTSATFRSGHD